MCHTSVLHCVSVLYYTVLKVCLCTVPLYYIYCTILYAYSTAAMYCTIPVYRTVPLYYTVLYYSVLYYNVLYCTIVSCTLCTVLYLCTILYLCTVLYCTVLYCCTVPLYSVLYLCTPVLYLCTLYATRRRSAHPKTHEITKWPFSRILSAVRLGLQLPSVFRRRRSFSAGHSPAARRAAAQGGAQGRETSCAISAKTGTRGLEHLWSPPCGPCTNFKEHRARRGCTAGGSTPGRGPPTDPWMDHGLGPEKARRRTSSLPNAPSG
jgi:hypothetical protein